MGLFDFMAGAPANSPTSYQGMEARRRIALQLLANSKKGYPKTIGEGLTAVGDLIGDRAVLNQLAAQEAAYQKQAAAIGAGLIPSEARTPGPQSEDTTQPAPARTAYAPESDTQDQPAAPSTTLAGYRPAPPYLEAALAQDVADPERRAYLGQLAGKEAQSADEVSPTGAAGPFQFTRGTGRQYGLMPDGQDWRTDIHGSIAAVQNLTDDNAATLTKMLGRAPSPGELALAHQQGAVTAGRMLTGAGNAPAGNLAVNNVNPGASPQAAAAKIMGYYGMPSASANPRDALAATLAQRQGVPQPNPTLAGPSAALPLSASTPTPGGSDLPPEILTGASAIRPAPRLPSQIQPAPVQVAQATPPGVPPGLPAVRAPLTGLPQRPVTTTPPLTAPRQSDVPMQPEERQGWAVMPAAQALGDPTLIARAEALIRLGQEKSKQIYEGQSGGIIRSAWQRRNAN
jgi:flagellar protein FlgJ